MQCDSFCPIAFDTIPTCFVCGLYGRCKKETAPGAANTGDGKAVNENLNSKTAPLYQKITEVARMNKQEYIQEIVDLMNQCNDITLLDLVFKILHKSL